MSTGEGPGADTTGQVITAVLDDRSSTIELTVTGCWDRHLWLEARRTIRKCLTSQPAGLLLDLLHLHDPYAASACLWFSMEEQAHRMASPVPVVACVPDETALAGKLRRLGARLRLPLFPDVPRARVALAGHRPLTDQIRLELFPERISAFAARQVVTAACLQWQLTAVARRAELVISELVINAVEHAGTEIRLTVTRLGPLHTGLARRHRGLRLTVHDLEPELPPLPHGRAPELTPSTMRGQGLHIVDAAADFWGALSTRTGKVVWAALWHRE